MHMNDHGYFCVTSLPHSHLLSSTGSWLCLVMGGRRELDLHGNALRAKVVSNSGQEAPALALFPGTMCSLINSTLQEPGFT